MWGNTVTIHNVFFLKKLRNEILNQLNMKKKTDKDNSGKKNKNKS